MLETFAHDVLNSLTAHIAVLNERGVIIAVNEAWKRFAIDNVLQDTRFCIGTDYLAVCERSMPTDPDGTANAALDGLRAIMRGETDVFSIEYPCHSPAEERWFCLRATRPSGTRSGVVVAHENITLRRKSENALRETERMLRHVLETLPVGVWIVDRAGGIVQGNAAGQRIWGGAPPITSDDSAATRAIRKGEASVDEEIEIEAHDGTRKILLNSAIPLHDDGGAIAGAILVHQDITARKHNEKELEQALARERILARTDALTGATNRRHFFELAAHEMAMAKRYHQPLSVILFDVDHFKRINDTAGHDTGDETLRQVARIVRDHLREVDLFARYGGEEFVLLLPRTTIDQATIVAERIREQIAAEASITISSGVAELEPESETIDLLIGRADDALYQAKQQGRNRTIASR